MQYLHSTHSMSESFSITREINLEKSRGAKFAILTNFEALNFDIYEFLHFLNAKIDQINKI